MRGCKPYLLQARRDDGVNVRRWYATADDAEAAAGKLDEDRWPGVQVFSPGGPVYRRGDI